MSGAKHTPGPWVLATVPTSVGTCHKIGPFPNGSRAPTFACVYADGHRLGIDDDNQAPAELAANARVIAAAPDLLEALQRLHEACVKDGWPAYGAHPHAMEVARAAIAKATGGTQ